MPSPNGSPAADFLARPQLRGHVREQQPGRDHRGAWRAAHRAEQFGLGHRAVVVQVERVAARRVPLREVGPRPPRRHRQVPPQLCLRHAQPLVGEGDLRRAPEHRGLPLRPRVVVVREGGDDRAHVRGLRHGVHRPRQRQQGPRGPARGLITRSRQGELRAEGVVRGVAPRQLGADRLARRRRLEHRPVLDVVGRRSGLGPEPVLGLRQEPEVVVAVDLRVAVADPDLDVHDLLGRVPQLAHPPQPELRLVPQRGGGRPAGVPRGQQQQRVRVARREAELLVPAAGVEPAAGDVHRSADLGEAADQVVVAVVLRRGVDGGARVREVRRLTVEHRRAPRPRRLARR